MHWIFIVLHVNCKSCVPLRRQVSPSFVSSFWALFAAKLNPRLFCAPCGVVAGIEVAETMWKIMKCNACWKNLEGRAVATTCGHIFCILLTGKSLSMSVSYVLFCFFEILVSCCSPSLQLQAPKMLRKSWALLTLTARCVSRRFQRGDDHWCNISLVTFIM